MAYLGHSGYALYRMDSGEAFIVSPEKTALIDPNGLDYELVALLETATEDDNWIDHKINWSIVLYGGEFNNDISEGT